jgi:acyl-coenzyme A thioesterase PaaI-like protein
MGAFADWTVEAHNTATESENKIHDDAVAKRFGFTGGLVPGVDVYAYMTHPPADAWGVDWLERGTLRARFVSPVYEGERIVIAATPAAGGRSVILEVRNPRGDVCATGEATMPAEAKVPADVARWPAVEPPADRPPASAATLAAGTALGLSAHTFRADRAREYLDDVRETLPLYRDERVAHPGWLLRDANYVLSRSVRLGPWIHVESDTTHLSLVRDGEAVSARAIVEREWEHKGHRFVALDVLMLADDTRPVARVRHTAIHTPRQIASS